MTFPCVPLLAPSDAVHDEAVRVINSVMARVPQVVEDDLRPRILVFATAHRRVPAWVSSLARVTRPEGLRTRTATEVDTCIVNIDLDLPHPHFNFAHELSHAYHRDGLGTEGDLAAQEARANRDAEYWLGWTEQEAAHG